MLLLSVKPMEEALITNPDKPSPAGHEWKIIDDISQI